MAHRIVRYDIDFPAEGSLVMAAGAEIVAFHLDARSNFYVWALVRDHPDTERRRFMLIPSNKPFEGEKMRYIATAVAPNERGVMHLLELKP